MLSSGNTAQDATPLYKHRRKIPNQNRPAPHFEQEMHVKEWGNEILDMSEISISTNTK